MTQVAGPTKVSVCHFTFLFLQEQLKGIINQRHHHHVVITRIQRTPKSFRMNTGDVGALKRLENCAVQDNSKSSPTYPETRCIYPEGGCEEKNGV
jgi:hypothetical protein